MAGAIEGPEEFDRDEEGSLTPAGQQQRWQFEFHAARARLKKWHKQGERIFDRYLDERSNADTGESRLNLFTANVETQHAMLYGKIPTADVARAFSDASDDVARVASEMLERLLTPASTTDPYVTALGYALEDRLLPGLGFACARYEVETGPATDKETGEPILDAEGEPVEEKVRESAEVDYHYWKSILWSPCRVFEDSRWFGWSSPMTRKDMAARFGDVAKLAPLNSGSGKKDDADAEKANPYATADVWEVWCRQDRKVYWLVEGAPQILDVKDDPLGLEGFYPFPRPMFARATTRSLVPRPDFVIAQDLYNEIDTLTTRINLLEKAVRVAGVYDKTSPEVANLLNEGGFNKLYPAENYAALIDKGGMEKAVSWFPLEAVTGAIAVLTEKRVEKIGLLQQVTGWSDIMRGQSNASETLGAQQMKAQYGSVRISKFQADFARFATDLQRIRAEIIAKHFDEKTIIERSNAMQSELVDDPMQPGRKVPNVKLIEAAARLIKSKSGAFRIEVKPENINLTDYAQMKQERAEAVTALGSLIQATAPLIEALGPPAAEFVLATAAWLLAGTKGGDSLESEFDQFRAKLQAAAAAPKPPPPPDPKMEAAKAKAAADIQGAQLDAQGKQMDFAIKKAEHGMALQGLAAEAQANQINAQTRIVEARAMPMHGGE
jgi:hypothetical protein